MKKQEKVNLKTSGQRLKYIRVLLHLSQKKMAEDLQISQSTLSQIENDHYTISIDSLENLQDKHGLNCNWFVSGRGNVFLIPESEDIEEVRESIFEETIPFKGKKKKKNDASDIPLIDANAKAGYVKNSGSPEYMRTLEVYQIPGFEIADNHRIFQVEGDSMEPTLKSGDFVICDLYESAEDISNGELVVLVSEEGIFTKRIYTNADDPTYYILKSDNPDYQPFLVKTVDIMEIWKVEGLVTRNLYQTVRVDEKKISRLEHDVETLKEQLKKLLDK